MAIFYRNILNEIAVCATYLTKKSTQKWPINVQEILVHQFLKAIQFPTFLLISLVHGIG